MQFNIPQFIDKEDKIVGPFTAKQLGWMFGAGATVLVLWNLLALSSFIIATIFVVGIFGALAFWRPYNQTCLSFILSVFSFFSKPKFYLWRRMPEKNVSSKKNLTKAETKKMITTEGFSEKKLSEDKIREISKVLDEY